MATDNLRRFIGNMIISERARDQAMSDRLVELLREHGLDEEEVTEILAARSQSLTELCATVETMVLRRESQVQTPLPYPEALLRLRAAGPIHPRARSILAARLSRLGERKRKQGGEKAVGYHAPIQPCEPCSQEHLLSPNLFESRQGAPCTYWRFQPFVPNSCRVSFRAGEESRLRVDLP